MDISSTKNSPEMNTAAATTSECSAGRNSSPPSACDLILLPNNDHNNNVEVQIHLDLLLPSSKRSNHWTKLIPNDNPLVPHKFQDKFLQWIVDPKNTSVGEGGGREEKSVSSTQGDDDSGGKENDTTRSIYLKTKLCTELQALLMSSSSISSSSTSAARSQPTPRKRTRSSFSSDFSSPPAPSTRKKMKMTPQGSASGSGLRQRRSLVQRSAGKSSKYLLSQFRDLDMTVKARYFLSFVYLLMNDSKMTKSNNNNNNNNSHENKIVTDLVEYLDVLTTTTMSVKKLDRLGLDIMTMTKKPADTESSTVASSSPTVLPTVLGEGSFGTVYLLSSVDKMMFYALKVFQQSVDADDAKHEAETQEFFDHPGIVKGIDHCIDSFFTWMVSVAVDGRSSSQKQQCEPFKAIDLHSCSISNKKNEKETTASTTLHIDGNARRFFAGAVLALLQIHSCGKCHRDVKPDNCVLFGGDPGCPVLIDLGEGSAIDSDGGNTTVAGAYEYRDHQMNEDGYDPVKADLYSLALTTIAISIGVDEYENLTTEEGWTKPTTKGPAIQSAFETASKILRQDAVEMLRRMTGDELCDRPTYREIFSNPWVVQGWNEIKDVEHYDVTKSMSLKQQSFMIDSFKA